MDCEHFKKNSKQASYWYSLKGDNLCICSGCNTKLRRSMIQQLADEAGLKLMHAKL